MCGCRSSSSSSAALARRAGNVAATEGLSATDPYVVGLETDGEDVQRVRVVRPVGDLKLMQAAWVTGDGVEALVASGDFVVIGGVDQLGRLWRVGGRTYHDYRTAQRVANATGQTLVEVA